MPRGIDSVSSHRRPIRFSGVRRSARSCVWTTRRACLWSSTTCGNRDPTVQTARVFQEFTVREQITLGCNSTLATHPASSIVGIGRRKGEDAAVAERVDDLIRLCGLADAAERLVGTLSSAQQRFLMIATALASQPKVVLIDEPAAGLVAHERKTLSALISAIRNRDVSVLVIEHHMALIMEVCDRIVVLNFGSKIAEGTPAEIRSNRAVIDAYLGEAA